MPNTIFVTGGAGFIGSAVVRLLLAETDQHVVNIDKLTYAGNIDTLRDAMDHPRHSFHKVDVADASAVRPLFEGFSPWAVMHLAAESHVDRSIDGPAPFVRTNVVGTYEMLEAARAYRSSLPDTDQARFRFHHVSTDEVFGSLGETGAFTESTPYQPRSPYSATKAASDHLVRSWHATFGLPTLVSNCSNNYGPYQYPEKLIPVVILKACHGEVIPVYGSGRNVRDWLYVEDHARALWTILNDGRVGDTYNVGGSAERNNLDVVNAVCAALDDIRPRPDGVSYKTQIEFVQDRPGHDFRYAIDARKITAELGWRPAESFTTGIRKTVQWYLDNAPWVDAVRAGKYRGERLGVGAAS